MSRRPVHRSPTQGSSIADTLPGSPSWQRKTANWSEGRSDGDSKAFDELAKRYVKLVHGVIFEAVRRSEEVDDLSQEVFCKAYLELTKLRKHCEIRPLAGKNGKQRLYRLASRSSGAPSSSAQGGRQGGGSRRHASRDRKGEDAGTETGGERGARGVDGGARPRQAGVPEGAHPVHIEGCSYEQICSFLGLSFATVKMRLYKGKKLLREEFEAMQSDCGRWNEGNGAHVKFPGQPPAAVEDRGARGARTGRCLPSYCSTPRRTQRML